VLKTCCGTVFVPHTSFFFSTLLLFHFLLPNTFCFFSLDTPMIATVGCWNVLADCYTSVPWEDRQHLLSTALVAAVKHQGVSLLLLQEVDHAEDFFRPLLTSLGMKMLFVQRPAGKEDGCLIAYDDQKFELVAQENVDFDDLATIMQGSDNYKRQTFLRHNVSLLAHFRCRATSSSSSHVTVANTHHYWNPNFPEVKAGQVKYLLDRLHSFQQRCGRDRDRGSPPSSGTTHVLLGGDFNSLPGSEVYRLLTQPFHCALVSTPLARGGGRARARARGRADATRRYLLPSKYLHRDDPLLLGGDSGEQKVAPSFICDETLSRFCRWLRILGVSCTMLKTAELQGHRTHQERGGSSSRSSSNGGNMTSEQEVVSNTVAETTGVGASVHASTMNPKELLKAEKARKKLHQNNLYLSKMCDTARREERVILTTNKQWQQRADLPESFLVDYSDMAGSVAALFSLYGLPLCEDRFLTICGEHCSVADCR
jgi:uncharacterized protein with PIN domain